MARWRPDGTLRPWFSARWHVLLERLWPHRIALAVVLLACAIGQAAVLMQRPLVSLVGDGFDYLAIAQRIGAGQQFLDPLRTPGYPAFLALVFALTGGVQLTAVVLVQAALTVTATVGVYVLAIRLGGARWAAALAAALVGANPYTVNFERNILTETLSFWLMIVLFLCFERYLRFERRRTLVAIVVLCVAAILTRPIFIFLPVLFAVLLGWQRVRTGRLRAHWRAGLLALGVIYALVGVYAGLNGAATSYVGLSDIGDFNLCGKLLEYRLYDLPVAGLPAAEAQLRAGLSTYMRVAGRNPWDYVNSHPEYERGEWQVPASLMRAEIVAHPGAYLRATARDSVVVFYVAPFLYVNYQAFATPGWIAVLLLIFTFAARLSALVPLLLLAQTMRVWRQPRSISSLVLLVALAALTADMLITAISDDTDFWRLRFPFDWVLTLACVFAAIDLVRVLAVWLAALRAGSRRMRPDASALRES